MDALFQDARFALRSLRKSPAFSCAAIATIALGIGATTAIFSAMNAALLRRLPFPQSEDLFTLRTTITTGRMTSGLVAPVELNGLTDANGPIVRAAGSVMTYDTILDETSHPVQISLAGVTEGFFELFNVPMVLGRSFAPEEFIRHEQTVAPRVIVLSSHLWRTAFGSDPHIVGRSVQFSGRASPVVGIASPAYDGITTADAWFNLALDRRSLNHSYDGYMRARHHASPAAVDRQLTSVATRLANEFPVFNTNRVFVARPLIDAIVGDLKPTLIIAFAATALLLVIACVNVMNLLLARGTARIREIAVRAALGASRAALVRYVLLEGLILSAIGGVIGVLVARGGVRLLLVLAQSRLPRLETVPLDPYVTAFAIAVTLATGIGVGLIPAVRLLRADVGALLGDGGRSATGGRAAHRTLTGMIAAEMALAVTLVAGAGWLVQNYRHLQNARSGFLAEHRLIVDVLLPAGRYREPEQIAAWNHALQGRIGQLNGVGAVGASTSIPLRPERDSTFNFTVAGDAQSFYPPSARYREVTPGWFEAMGIRVEAGRSFAAEDQAGVGGVVIVNEALAARYLPGRDPLEVGLVTSAFSTKENPNPVVPIVGVVADVKYASISERPEPVVYAIGRYMNRESIVVATSIANPSNLVPLIRAEVQKLDPLVPVDFELLPNVVSGSLSRQRLGMLLMSLFGMAGVALAAIGVYGVIAYAIAQRIREVAIRLALGATPAEVFWLTVIRAQVIAVAGGLGGLLLAYPAGRILVNTLYEVRAADPVILVPATMLVAGVALIATVLPARRAARVDPILALRTE
ncbi:MAG TPA: ABC transporter permease [Vicinamibacterales bacterium]|nr:ABC transporter permease [Vicinamibacterales bacterium]